MYYVYLKTVFTSTKSLM